MVGSTRVRGLREFQSSARWNWRWQISPKRNRRRRDRLQLQPHRPQPLPDRRLQRERTRPDPLRQLNPDLRHRRLLRPRPQRSRPCRLRPRPRRRRPALPCRFAAKVRKAVNVKRMKNAIRTHLINRNGRVAPQSQSAVAMLLRHALPADRQNSARPVPIYERGS